MRRLPLALLLVIALLLSACGGDDDDEAADRAGNGATTSSSAPEDDATSTSEGGSSSTTAAASDDADGDGGGTSTTRATTATTARGATATTVARTGPQPTRPGVYTYSVQGETTFGATRQPAPPESKTTVDKANGTDQRSRSEAGGESSEQILRYRPDGISLVYLRTNAGGFVTEFRPNPPVLFAPADLAPGKTWSWTMKSTNGQITVKASFRAVRNESVTIGGTAVQTIVVDATQEISGQVRATTKSSSWASLERSLIVKSQQTTTGTFNNVPVKSERRSQLRSLNPA